MKARHIQDLVPEAKVCFAHGRMTKSELENKMQNFVDYKFDVLVCTTIIETGIDIPNVNTLIVLDSDTFGLSQLYQLRGRVGRSNKIAYAYLMYKPSKILTETAKKRGGLLNRAEKIAYAEELDKNSPRNKKSDDDETTVVGTLKF